MTYLYILIHYVYHSCMRYATQYTHTIHKARRINLTNISWLNLTTQFPSTIFFSFIQLTNLP